MRTKEKTYTVLRDLLLSICLCMSLNSPQVLGWIRTKLGTVIVNGQEMVYEEFGSIYSEV
jgi:hypothetical protein